MSANTLVDNQITPENYTTHFKRFQKRQAGISLSYSNSEKKFFYNAYCVETELLKELFTVEYEFLEDALKTVNDEFATWELAPYEEKSGCSTCSNKK